MVPYPSHRVGNWRSSFRFGAFVLLNILARLVGVIAIRVYSSLEAMPSFKAAKERPIGSHD
jgi:hypothetical protein